MTDREILLKTAEHQVEILKVVSDLANIVEAHLASSTTSVAEMVAHRFEADPHQFSTRPCATCRDISTALGRPFGCVAKRQAAGSC